MHTQENQCTILFKRIQISIRENFQKKKIIIEHSRERKESRIAVRAL